MILTRMDIFQMRETITPNSKGGKVNRDILISWIEKVLTSKTGEELHLPVESKEQQKQLLKSIKKEVEILKGIDPVTASTLVPFKRVADGLLWVGIRKVMTTPLVGFIKRSDGTTERVEIKQERDRWRRLTLMKKDGLTLEEIEAIEGELTAEELLFIEGGKSDESEEIK